MKQKLRERAVLILDVGKRFGFCSLWLAAVQVVSCAVCFGALYLFGRDFQWEWLVYAAGLLLPVVWFLGGIWIPAPFRIRGRGPCWTFWLVWTVLPALLCIWAALDGPDILWVTLYPQLMARLAWFYPLFDGDQAAYVLENLQPLAAAGTHGLMMLGFSFGLWVKGRKKKT